LHVQPLPLQLLPEQTLQTTPPAGSTLPPACKRQRTGSAPS
jgi:hypothetical protein